MARDYNNEIQNVFTAENLVDLGYDYKDLYDAEMVPKIFFDKMAFEARNRGQLSALLTSLSSFSDGRSEAVVRWTAGDEQASTSYITTGETYVYGTDSSIALDTDALVAGDYIQLETYASSEYYLALLKVDSVKGKTVAGEYDVTEVNFESSSVATVYTFTDTSDVTSMVSTVPMDGIANDPNTLTPMPLFNFMERIRVSGVIGSHTNAGDQNWDGTINKQMKLKMVTFLEQLNLTLALRLTGGVNPETTAGNEGMMKTFRDFYSPSDRTGTQISGKEMAGNNCVLTVGTGDIDKEELEEWMELCTQYGNMSNEKVLVCTPAFLRKIWNSYMAGVTVQVSKFAIPGTEKIWKGTTIEMNAGTLRLVPDKTLAKSTIYVEDNCMNDTTEASTKLWGVMIDPEFTKLVYRNVPADPINPGIQSPKIMDVNLTNNNTNRVKEITAELTLMIKRCEVGGYICIAS